MLKNHGFLSMITAAFASAIATHAWAQAQSPSADDMIKALAAPAGQSATTRGFHRNPHAITDDSTPDSEQGGGDDAKPSHPSRTAAHEGRREIGVPLLFALNSAQIRPESIPTLSEIGKALQSPALKDSKILLEGHTDASGGAEKNLELSAERAQAVKDYLVQNSGIDAARLTTVGKGQSDPANPANPLAPENRRVVLVNISKN